MTNTMGHDRYATTADELPPWLGLRPVRAQ
jgi:hypothetical protein